MLGLPRARQRPHVKLLDDVDRALIHALRIDGRAPFSRIAEVLRVSAQTVARRYARLRAKRWLRVVGITDPYRTGQSQWMVRITATAQGAQNLAQSLVRRTDTAWVRLASGGTEIVLILLTSVGVDGDSLLLRDIPRTAGISSVSANCLLHTYLGGRTGWGKSGCALDDRQQAMLRQGRVDVTVHRPARQLVTELDNALLAALQRDGRASHAELAAATGWSAATVARWLADLQASGVIFFDVEVDPVLFGITTQTLLWASVAPAHLDRVARTLAQHEELAFVATTTGPTNLVASAACTSPAALHHFLTHKLGPVSGILSVETAPVLRTLKAASPVPYTDPAVSGIVRSPRPTLLTG
ncbi:MAG: AsnC family transcriptional regulator [Actinobacteria bacterium 13_2_20CM_2_71_6]|nr:MAG: AsnC family transcriptional regulator [Actinobacteria bacterium 13_2_20CM_2_71_6]